jgi:hypothetical protein
MIAAKKKMAIRQNHRSIKRIAPTYTPNTAARKRSVMSTRCVIVQVLCIAWLVFFLITFSIFLGSVKGRGGRKYGTWTKYQPRKISSELLLADLVFNSSLGSYTLLLPPFPGHRSRSRSLRKLPYTGSTERLYAEMIYNSTNGSFWLPQKPATSTIEGGYEFRTRGANDFQTSYYKNTTGFVHEDFVNILMYHSFNSGDFLAFFAAPMIAGRAAHLFQDANQIGALAVVGSVLHNGPRYSWGAGFIEPSANLSSFTEILFAERGPVSYKQAISTNPVDKTDASANKRQISKVYGDLGLLMSWFYQPHKQTKIHPLCLIPHYVDTKSPFVSLILQDWKGGSSHSHSKAHLIDIQAPLFSIMNELVQCEFVLSSSLHGLIFSDSYGIPNGHMELSDKVVGGGHKFDDYFESVNRTRTTLQIISDSSSMDATISTTSAGATANTTSIITARYVQDWVRKSAASYNPSYINVLPFWQNCPIHAESYNRTREEHVVFAHLYAKSFSLLLEGRASRFSNFKRDVTQVLDQFPKRP